MRRSATFVALLVLSAGCGVLPTEPTESILPFNEVVYQPTSGFETPLRTVLRSEAEWQTFSAVLYKGEVASPTPVDFREFMLIASARGSAPDGCYATEVKRIALQENVVSVLIADTRSTGSCGCLSVVVTPVQVVSVARVEGPVEFSVTNETRECSS